MRKRVRHGARRLLNILRRTGRNCPRTVSIGFRAIRCAPWTARTRGTVPPPTARRTLTHLLPPTRLISSPRRRKGRSEEHTSELQSLMRISYAVFCLKKKNKQSDHHHRDSIQHIQLDEDKETK